MFHKISLRNAKRNISQYLIYFVTLVIAAASFYVVLAIDSQDVITFLKVFESTAVNKLLIYIQIIFIACLVLMFFLIVFANKFLIKRRRKEMGVYMMMGMKQSKVFSLLILEGMITSIFALLTGLIIGIILSDFISLLSAKIFAVDIIGHKFMISPKAILMTTVGFMIIQLIAIFIQSLFIYRLELAELLYGNTKKKKAKEKNLVLCILVLISGAISLAIAYFTVIKYGLIYIPIKKLIISVLLGFYGTMAVFYGLTNLIGSLGRRNKSKYYSGLNAFTSRQIHEQVAGRFIGMGLISLLLFLSITMISNGCSVALSNEAKNKNSVNVFDFTLQYNDYSDINLDNLLKSSEVSPYVDNVILTEVGRSHDKNHNFDLSELYKITSTMPNENQNLTWSDYIIKSSSYDKVLALAGKKQLNLKPGEIGIYNDPNFSYSKDLLDKALKMNTEIKIDNEPYKLVGEVNDTNFVTDTIITISLGLIMNDEDYDKLVDNNNIDSYLNFTLPKDLVKEEGKVGPTQYLRDYFMSLGLSPKTSLESYSRQLFMTISSSYTLIYMGIIFLIITGTVLALQFITEIRDNKIRYQTLTDVGASEIQMKKSIHKQITLFFILPLFQAIISSSVAIKCLSDVVSSRGFDIKYILIQTIFTSIILLLIYGLYYLSVRKSADKIIDSLKQRLL